MFTQIRAFREKLTRGEPCLGAGITFSDPAVSEAIGRSADFLWIDLEHNPIGLESMQAHLIAARAAGVAALVRVPGSAVATLKPVLDAGAPGLIVPQVGSLEEVRGVVDACRYWPLGTRGFGPRRPSNYGRVANAEYMETANRELFVAVQIENTAALDQLDAIAAVPHLDSLVIGPYDLSLSMDVPVAHADVRVAMRRIVAAARRHGLFVGIGMGAGDDAFAVEAIGLGVNWLQVGGDSSYMIHCADELYGRIRRNMQP